MRCYKNTLRKFCCLNLLLLSHAVSGLEVDLGYVSGNIDTTLSYGQLYRMQTPSGSLIGISNGGTAASVNGDDGNLNYDTGLISKTGKVTIEADLNIGQSSGLFFRGFGFRDGSADDTSRTALTDEAERLVQGNAVLRDLYAWHAFDLFNRPAEIRIGEQVLSWGESTFIQNSINTINPVDVSSLRTPGSELREGLVPVGMVNFNLALTNNLSIETYYQYDWQQTEIDPLGSYFSTNDFASDGAQFLVGAGVGTIPDYVTVGTTLVPTTDITAAAFGGLTGPQVTATRTDDLEPGNGGEYGIALRLFAPSLNQTEFGFYHIHYHSRLPIINGRVSTGLALAGAEYQISYPDDINLYGFSFNTELGNSGIAFQGEYSFRQDAPLQIDDVEILAAALSGGVVPNQIGTFAPGEFIPGHIERNVSQMQFTASKIFGPTLGADQLFLISEWAMTHVHNMPGKSDLLLDAPGTYTSGNPNNVALLAGHTLISPNRFADATSWGYRVAGRLDYNNALFDAVNLQTRFAWQHDVGGITPGPGGNFVAGRKILNLGIRATYLNQWEADLSYTTYIGDHEQHLLHDRDFLAFNVKYAF
ncbi:MAG: DUF1302 domain-containing protein [Pseudomonadota bacterium]